MQPGHTRKHPFEQVANFTIIACSAHGIRFEDGGDTFTVGARFNGLGIRVRMHVIDNDDGSYLVTYKPPASGRLTIRVSLARKELPGSPFACTVAGLEGPAPSASKCTVFGDALSQTIARAPSKFYVNFRNELGSIAHASELDVWVQTVSGGPTSRASPEAMRRESGENADGSTSEVNEEHLSAVAQVLTPPAAFESFVVGSTPLEVSRTADLNSLRIGQLKPGRVLKLIKVEPPTEQGKPDGFKPFRTPVQRPRSH